MTSEVVETRIIKGWDCDFTIRVIKSSDYIRIKETHSGTVSDEHCAEVVISLSEMDFTWVDRRGNIKAKGGFASHIPLFKAAENKFIDLLSHHLKMEHNEEKFGPKNWNIVRWDLKRALSSLVPEKEMKKYNVERDKESVLRGLKRARSSAKIYGYSHIVLEINRLIEEVALFDPIKEEK